MTSSSGEPTPEEQGQNYEARIIGMALDGCQKCHGRGRVGWLDNENARVQPCPCVQYFDVERLEAATSVAQSDSRTEEKVNGGEHS